MLAYCLLLLVPGAFAQSLTGTWTGTYNITESPGDCPNLGAYSGPMTLQLQSSGSSVSGTGTLSNVPFLTDCAITGRDTDTSDVVASVSGGQFTGLFSGGAIDGLSFTATVTGSQMTGQFTDLTGTFTLTLGTGTLQFTTAPNLPNATVGTVYTQALNVTGATGTVTYHLGSGSSYPPGLSLDQSSASETGINLTGTPTEAGSFAFEVVASEACAGCTTSQEFNLNIAAANSGPLTINGITSLGRIDPASAANYPAQSQQACSLNGLPATTFTQIYTASGGDGNYTWKPEAMNPFFGLSFTNCTTGSTCTLTGVPVGATAPNANVFFEKLILTDDLAGDAPATAVIEGMIQADAPLTPLTATGPVDGETASVGLPYQFTGFEKGLSGGRAPYTCVPTGQTSQDGLTLSVEGQRCVIRATNPTQPGPVSFSATIKDSCGQGPVTVTVNINVEACSSASNPGQPCATPQPVSDLRGHSRINGVLGPARNNRPAASAGSSSPSISTGGVVDVAAYQPVMAPGGVMAIFGTNMANGVFQANSTPLPLSLGGVEVTVNGENAPLYSVSPGLIDFQAPVDPAVYYPLNTTCLLAPVNPATFVPDNCPAPGNATVMVIDNGELIGAVSVPVSTSAPAVLTLPDATVIATHANNQLITQNSPAQAGETIVIYGIDIGYPACDVITGYPSPAGCLTNSVPQLTFPDYSDLNDETTFYYAGLTPTVVGLAQFNLELPASWPAAALASGSIRMRIGDPTTGQTFSLYLPASGGTPVASIASLSPSSATAGAGAFTLTINGTGFGSQTQVTFNLTPISVISVTSVQITAQVPASLIGSPGTVNIVVGNAGQIGIPASAVFSFTINPPAAPTITSVSPVSATAGGADFTLTVNGTNFTSGSAVQWNGSALPTTFVNATQLTASVSASLIAVAGTASITVSSGGQTSSSANFTINAASGGGSLPTVVTKLMSNTDGIATGSCVTPPAVSSFTTASAQVWLYFYVTGASVGDTTTINWLRPDGVVYEPESTAVEYTTECFAYHINVSGAAAASYPGTWTVQVLWNGSSLFSLNFTISSAPSVVTYTSLASYTAATTNTSLIGFNGILPAGSTFEGFNPLVVSGISFATTTPGANVNVTASNYYSPNDYTGPFIVASASASTTNTLNVTFGSPTYALAIDCGSLDASAATITLSNGFTYTPATLPGVGNTTFIGFVSTTPITGLSFVVASPDSWVVEDLRISSPN